MNHKRIKWNIILTLVFFLVAKHALASLEITEIMYAPDAGSDYEWVEIYNNGPDSIDLNKYRFFHGSDSGPLTLRMGTTTILAKASYALITKSLKDYSWLNLPLVLSAGTLSLPDKVGNTYIALSGPDKNILDAITYDPNLGGAKINKSSLTKINGVWQNGLPTPGLANQVLKISPKAVPVETKTKSSTAIQTNKSAPSETVETNLPKETGIIDLNNLNPQTEKKSLNISKSIYPYLGLAGIIILGLISFMIIRIKDKKEKGLTVEDMTITE